MQSSTQHSIQPSTQPSIQSSILPNQSPPRPRVIAGGFAETDAAGVVVGPFDGNLDELGARAGEAHESLAAEREATGVGRHLQLREDGATHELQAAARIGQAGAW